VLLPDITIQTLLGDGLGELIEKRLNGEFRDLSRSDMEHARRVQPLFFCPEAWDGKVSNGYHFNTQDFSKKSLGNATGGSPGSQNTNPQR
jgi:hypothetical protein